MRTNLMAALCAGASVLALVSPAIAQTAPDGSDGSAAAAEELEAVVVTGSRIRNGYQAPTPMTVATTEQLQQTTPSNIPEALNKLPQFAGSTQSAGSGNGSGSGPPNIFSGNFLNLRSFGAIRTLILQDGRRVPPTTLNGQVDTNMLPQMLVQRVDVVTGGASAVYGSDAVTGVVNFVLDTNFNGLKAQAQTGISDRGDSPSSRLGIAGGMDVLERGHVVFSVEHYQNAGIKMKEDREVGARVPVYTGAGTAADPFRLTYDARLSGSSLGGLVTSGPFNGRQFVGGALVPFNPGAPTRTNGVAVGGDGAYYTGLSANSPLRTDQLFARFDYDFSDSVSAYVQVSGAEARVDNLRNANAPPNPLTIFNGNPFLPASAQAQLTAGNVPSFTMARLNRDLATEASLDQTTTSVSATVGLTGRILENFVWDAYYTYGEARLRSRLTNNINYPRFFAALDAVRDPAGNTVCRVTLTNPGLYPGCAPLNLFGQNSASAEAKAYIYGDTQWQGINQVDDFAGSISGELFQGWAGPISAAFNVEYRSQSLVQASNTDPLAVASYTGIRAVRPPTTVWAYSIQGQQKGSNDVWEASGELVVPLLRDAPFAKRLEVSGALRHTDYSSSGGVNTWKVGLNYQPIDDLRFRLSESRDIRAPTLLDLYSGTTISQLNVNDAHTGITGIVPVQGGGNPDLVPEVARTTTAGFVYTPSWAPGLQLSVDYYNIRIKNAIATINGAQTAIMQECEASGGTSALCETIVRPLPFNDRTAANFPTLIYTRNQNIAQAYTHGVDVEASYSFDLADLAANAPGRMDLRLLWAHQPTLKSRSYAGSPVTEAAGVAGLSEDRVTGMVGYEVGPFSMDWQVRYSSKQERSGTSLQVYADPPLKAKTYADVNLSYRFKAAGHDAQAFVVVSNLFDTDPRVSPATNSAGSPGTGTPTVVGDDVVGRYYTVGLRMKY